MNGLRNNIFHNLLENLPDINFAEKDPAVIMSEIVATFEREADRTLFPGDPLRLLLLTFTYYLAHQRSVIDFSGKQNLLRYAQDGFIQNIAALLGVVQNEARAAVTTVEFTLSTALPNATLIPAGTRVTPGNKIFFATVDDAEIPAGALSVRILTECTQVGEIGNGFLAGQINRLVDTFSFHYTVQNVDESAGGADIEDIESFRERTRLAPESFSSAGPYGAYEYWAKTANQLIVDVSVESPSPGVVEIVPLLQGGEIPTQSVLDEVYAVCNADTRRPLTDHVNVRMPEEVSYSLDYTYFISRSNAAVGLSIQQQATQALDDFILWQKSALGRDINPSQLTKMLMKTGIKRVEIREPVHKVLEHFELGVADLENINVIYGGLEDD